MAVRFYFLSEYSSCRKSIGFPINCFITSKFTSSILLIKYSLFRWYVFRIFKRGATVFVACRGIQDDFRFMVGTESNDAGSRHFRWETACLFN